jgi:hypothetical protein
MFYASKILDVTAFGCVIFMTDEKSRTAWDVFFLANFPNLGQAMKQSQTLETATFHRPTTPSAFGFEAWSLAQDSSTQTKKAPGKDIVAGDIVILLHSHIVIATGPVHPTTGRFPQVSGNTNLAGSREGTHVLAHETHFTSVRSRIRFKI